MVLLLAPARSRAEDNQFELVKESRILFKVVSDVYSLDDIKLFAQKITSFSCMYQNSLIVGSFELSKQKLAAIQQIDLSSSLEPKNILIYDGLKNLVKVLKYIDTQSVQVDPVLYSALKDSYKLNSCGREMPRFNGMLANIIKAEVYFRSRFQDKSFWVSDAEIKKAMPNYPGKSRQAVRNIEEGKRKSKAISLFIDSVSKQVSDDSFY